jgi:splicing factor 3B subunit 1
LQACDEEKLLGHLGVVLYEYLGEEYPEVLGSILGALKSIVNVIGMTKMTPPIKDLLPRLTPILKNRHEKASRSHMPYHASVLVSTNRVVGRFVPV